MARGNPDYNVIHTQTSVITSETELPIAFQTGFSRLDNGGRVVWYENFTNGLYRYALGSSAGGLSPVVTMESNRCYGLNPSVRFDPVDNNGVSYMQAQPRLPLSGKIGIELSYYAAEDHGNIDITLAPVLGFGTHAGFQLRHEASTEVFKIYTGGTFLAVYTPPTPGYWNGKFICMKLVVDAERETYDSLLLGGERITLGQTGNLAFVGGDGGSAFHEFACSGAGGSLFEKAWLSYIVISADEQ
jgi:hypothetical protein